MTRQNQTKKKPSQKSPTNAVSNKPRRYSVLPTQLPEWCSACSAAARPAACGPMIHAPRSIHDDPSTSPHQASPKLFISSYLHSSQLGYFPVHLCFSLITALQVMLSFLVKSRPPRSRTAHLRQLSFDGGRSTAEFKAPGDRFLVINRLPHAVVQGGTNSSSPSSSSSLIPPLHRHWPQDETFHVLSGTAKFILGSNRKRVVKIAKVGEEVVIPRREAHTFYNASENEDLVIEFVLDPPLGRDEAYFRKQPRKLPSTTECQFTGRFATET